MKRRKVLSLTILAVLIIAWQFSFYSPRYIYRVLVWQDADYNDYEKFKYAELVRSDSSFSFIKGTDQQEKEVKFNFERLNAIRSLESFLKESKTNSFLVIRNDTLVYEKYYQNNTRESIQTSFSTSKSVLSLLVGLALQEGKLDDIDEPITNYLPELEIRDARFKRISIAHLLSMKSGLKYSHDVSFPFVTSDAPKTYLHPNLRKVALRHTEIDTTLPGEKFSYNNYNALLLGLILERATGQSATSYLQSRIWSKVGIEFNANWSTDEKEFEKMESGLNARAIDFAKIGRLVLNKGKWNNRQIINEEWIVQSTQPVNGEYEYGNPRRWTYKYFWWSIPEEIKESDFMAIGNFGQFIYISPTHNTIIIRNGEEIDGFDDDDWTEIFYNHLRQ